MKRVIRASTRYAIEEMQRSEAYAIVSSEFDQVLEALSSIFDKYGLEVTGYAGTCQFIPHPPESKWPYWHCRAIIFGDLKVDRDDIRVPIDYVDGINTILPASAIASACKAADRAQKVLDKYKTGWPDTWPESGSRSGDFITTLIKYAKDMMIECETESGVEREDIGWFPTESTPLRYTSINSSEIVFEQPYGEWLDEMYELALDSEDRNEFRLNYTDWLDSHLL